MKVIDILNKIANGEEVKFKILDNDEIKDEIFEVENGSLRNRTCGKWIEAKVSIDTWESISSYFLNKEVEIIEEDKKIEKLIFDKDCTCEWNFGEVYEKINEIIDKINEMEYATRYLLGEKVEEVVKETEKLLKGEK